MIKIGIMGENSSDTETLKVLIKRIAIKKIKFGTPFKAGGCGRLRKRCGLLAKLWLNDDVDKLIICHDADTGDKKTIKKLEDRLMKAVKDIPEFKKKGYILIPIQEIEAWFLADVECLNNMFKGMNLKDMPNPESQKSPKEFILKKSITKKYRSRYINAVHNPIIAQKIDLHKIKARCPAFSLFYNFIHSI